jgi:DNA mismatch endonuclease (patch repair protein)
VKLPRAPKASTAAVRKRMQAVRQRDTSAEVLIRRSLYAQGVRYRVHRRPLPDLNRRADIVFVGRRVAVFIHGCFWHRCPKHGSTPCTNGHWWKEKLKENERRDRETVRLLRRARWRVLVVWEHEAPSIAVRRIMKVLREASDGAADTRKQIADRGIRRATRRHGVNTPVAAL